MIRNPILGLIGSLSACERVCFDIVRPEAEMMHVQVGEDESSLVVFEKLFDGAQFRRGYDLTFSSTSSGSLAVQIAGKEVGTSCTWLAPMLASNLSFVRGVNKGTCTQVHCAIYCFGCGRNSMAGWM